MELLCEWPLFAVQRTPAGWLVRAPAAGDPYEPAVVAVAALNEPVWRPRGGFPRRMENIRMLGLVPRLDGCEGAEAALLPEWYLD